MIKLSRSAQLTLFSTALITGLVFFAYFFLVAEMEPDAAAEGLQLLRLFLLFVITSILAYAASALVIDKTLNPLRIMTAKIKDLGKMDFSKPLAIGTDYDELKDYVDSFNDMSQKLGLYIERQKRFISDASHELTTPITVINGHADLLLRHGKDDAELLDSGLAIIKSEILRMDELVDSLLLLARSDSGKQVYSIDTVDLVMLIKECVEEARLIAPEFIFEVDASGSIPIRCDGYAMRRVFRILLSNGVKHSGSLGTIRVSAGVSHGLVRVSVRDFGVGIPPEHLPLIFERFYRVDTSRNKKTGGSGLGLAIAKEIITAHGGEIHADSVFGEGTAFEITMGAS